MPMSPIEMARAAAAVAFLAVAGYSALRFAWSVTRRGRRPFRAGIAAADVPELSHVLMGVAMALMVSPAGPAVPEPLGIAAFAVLGAWFAARLRHDGVLSRAGRLGVLGGRDGASGHGGYHLHHLAGCAAMVLMYATGHGALASSATTASAAGAGVVPSGLEPDLGATALDAPAAAALDAHAAGAHAAVPPLAAICWLFALYFLVAATSLGFRVGESAIRVTHHATAPLPPSPPLRSPLHTPPRAPFAPAVPAAVTPSARVRLLASPAGTCASEVLLSAGMAVLFFSAL
jgi:hypothetical protein